MNTILTVLVIVALAFVVNVLLKQSYNLLFFVGRKPIAWIVSATVIGVGTWSVSAMAGWNVSVPAWACAIALVMNLPPRQQSSDKQRQVQTAVDEVYREMGIRNGRFLYRVGLAVFLVASVGSWVVLYGRVV